MKEIKKYNVSKAGRKYQDRQGNEKTIWDNVGTFTEFHKEDGSISRILEIPAIGLVANIYPVIDKENQVQAPVVRNPNRADAVIEYPTEEINPEDIPF